MNTFLILKLNYIYIYSHFTFNFLVFLCRRHEGTAFMLSQSENLRFFPLLFKKPNLNIGHILTQNMSKLTK